MKKVLLSAVLVLVASSAFAAISNTKHDLKTGGTSTYKGSSDQTCKYCHVPHAAIISQALWGRTNNYTASAVYANAGSLNSTPSSTVTKTQSAGCLGCHQTTPSLGFDTTTNLATGITGNANIGQDLSNDHPIAFTYDSALATADGSLNAPAGTGLPLFGGTMECATCHDVHGVASVPSFLRTTNVGSALCLKCHNK